MFRDMKDFGNSGFHCTLIQSSLLL